MRTVDICCHRAFFSWWWWMWSLFHIPDGLSIWLRSQPASPSTVSIVAERAYCASKTAKWSAMLSQLASVLLGRLLSRPNLWITVHLAYQSFNSSHSFLADSHFCTVRKGLSPNAGIKIESPFTFILFPTLFPVIALISSFVLRAFITCSDHSGRSSPLSPLKTGTLFSVFLSNLRQTLFWKYPCHYQSDLTMLTLLYNLCDKYTLRKQCKYGYVQW